MKRMKSSAFLQFQFRATVLYHRVVTGMSNKWKKASNFRQFHQKSGEFEETNNPDCQIIPADAFRVLFRFMESIVINICFKFDNVLEYSIHNNFEKSIHSTRY